MIDIMMKIEFEKSEPLEIYVCSIHTSKKEIEEVRQALNGERWYNNSELDFDGFIYNKGE